MWPWHKNHNNLITIIFGTDHMVCLWLAMPANNNTFHLKICKTVPLTHHVTHNLNNLTALKHEINQFFNRYHVPQAYTAIAVADEHSNQHTMLNVDLTASERSHVTSQSCRLYTDAQGNSIEYASTITHPMLMQYKLLAHSSSLNLIMLTTQPLALLSLHHHLQKTANNQNPMHNLTVAGHDFLPLISTTQLASMVTGYTTEHHASIAIAAGLAIASNVQQL